MKKIVGKIKRYKYFFCIMLLIITQVFVCVELNKKQIETVSSYNGIDEGTSQILSPISIPMYTTLILIISAAPIWRAKCLLDFHFITARSIVNERLQALQTAQAETES